jgi:hypothetical protein
MHARTGIVLKSWSMKPRIPGLRPIIAGCLGTVGLTIILGLLGAGLYIALVMGFMELLSTGKHTILDNLGFGR